MNAAANEKTMFGDNFVIFFLYAAATSHYICVPSSQLIAHHEKVLILFIILCNYNKQECCVLLCRRRVWNRNIRKVAQQTFRRIEARIGIGIVRNGMTEEITRWKITCQFDRQPNSMSYTFNLSRWNDRGEGGVLCGVFDVWCVLAMCPTSSHSSVDE